MTEPNDLVTDSLTQSPDGHIATLSSYGVPGLTKREYFASMAMQGLLITEEGQNALPEIVASWSVEQADALIKALNK